MQICKYDFQFQSSLYLSNFLHNRTNHPLLKEEMVFVIQEQTRRLQEIDALKLGKSTNNVTTPAIKPEQEQ